MGRVPKVEKVWHQAYTDLDEIMGSLSVSSYQDTKTDKGEKIISS
jgi:hypothetical protein